MPQKITPCLWFDGQAEEAAEFYVGIFRNSKITTVGRYPETWDGRHGQQPGSVMIVVFELDGKEFTALNGGPYFKFNEAVSLQVECADQAEVDYFWEKLSAGGDPEAQQCGWLKDRYGLSWQIIPKVMPQMMISAETAKSARAFAAMMEQVKPDIAALERAFAG